MVPALRRPAGPLAHSLNCRRRIEWHRPWSTRLAQLRASGGGVILSRQFDVPMQKAPIDSVNQGLLFFRVKALPFVSFVSVWSVIYTGMQIVGLNNSSTVELV